MSKCGAISATSKTPSTATIPKLVLAKRETTTPGRVFRRRNAQWHCLIWSNRKRWWCTRPCGGIFRKWPDWNSHRWLPSLEMCWNDPNDDPDESIKCAQELNVNADCRIINSSHQYTSCCYCCWCFWNSSRRYFGPQMFYLLRSSLSPLADEDACPCPDSFILGVLAVFKAPKTYFSSFLNVLWVTTLLVCRAGSSQAENIPTRILIALSLTTFQGYHDSHVLFVNVSYKISINI